jgi:Ca2+-transporting ATPase
MSYIFAVHVPIAGLSLLPVLFKWPLVLLPVHIMFMELIIDPACSVVFEAEPEEEGVMSRPPRNPSDPLFSLHTVGISLLQGMAVLLIMLVIYVASLRMGQPEDEARALTFTSLIVANLGLILINRSWTRTILSTLKTPNGALWWVMGGAAGFMGLVLYVPFLQKLFHFSSLGWFDILICLAAGLLSIAWFEAMKVLSRRHLLPDSLCLKQ